MLPPPPRSTLFPYTTLFRSHAAPLPRQGDHRAGIACRATASIGSDHRSEEHTSELQSRGHLVCRLLLEKKNNATDACATAITRPCGSNQHPHALSTSDHRML